MSAGVNEVKRLLDGEGVPYVESDSGHMVRWKVGDVDWEYAEKLYVGRVSRLTAHRVDPAVAVAMSLGRGEQ